MKTTRRLTAVALVLLLLLSLCGCMAGKPPAGQGGETTAAPTQTETTAPSASATTASSAPTTAETTAVTTVVTTQVTTSAETVPLVPKWTVSVQDEVAWDGGIAGTSIEFGGQRNSYKLGNLHDLFEKIRNGTASYQGGVVNTATEYSNMIWKRGKSASSPDGGFDFYGCKIPEYGEEYFDKNVLVELLFENTASPYSLVKEERCWYVLESITVESETLNVYITAVDVDGSMPRYPGVVERFLVEVSREDVKNVQKLSLYVAKKTLTSDECVQQYGVEFMRCCEIHDNLSNLS